MRQNFPEVSYTTQLADKYTIVRHDQVMILQYLLRPDLPSQLVTTSHYARVGVHRRVHGLQLGDQVTHVRLNGRAEQLKEGDASRGE